MSSNNVINLNERRKKLAKTQKKPRTEQSVAATTAPVVDMTVRRQEALTQERRTKRRTILTEFIGVFVVVPRMGLKKVELYDISEGGIAFDMDEKEGRFKVGEEIAMRLYVSQKNYFPFTVNIANIRGVDEEGTFRHGGNFVKGTVNQEALGHFVRFIESVSLSLQSDHGDLLAPVARR